MSTTLVTTRRPKPTTSSSQQTLTTTSASLRLDAATPSGLSSHNIDLSLIGVDTAIPTPSATVTGQVANAIASNTSAAAVETCSIENDCATDRTCSEGQCVNANEAAPFGGPGSGSTSTLSTASAIGVGAGVIVTITLLIGLAICVWKARGRRQPKDSLEAPAASRHRSPSNATDQKTLVASLPNSPQHVDFRNQAMAPEFFAKALEYNEASKEKAVYNGQETASGTYRVEDVMGKELPAPPPTESPLPPAPVESKRYAINVNINKSMIFDDEMISAVSPLRDPGTPRERAPKYKFEEYLPPVAKPPTVTVMPASNKRLSEHELERYPVKHISIQTATTAGASSENELGSPVDQTLLKSESGPPQLPLPDLPPPSPSFSFRSYDWYQDIIGDPTSAHTPTQATFARPFSSNQNPRGNSALVPEPLFLNAPHAAAGSLLHPQSAGLSSPSSPSSPNFRLSPAVYMPSRLSQSPDVPPTPPPLSARISALSTMTRTTHNSRSWLPEEGLYLAEEGTHDSYMRFKRSDDASRPTSYSPLT
ncbi:hypothetical protein T440DRAFT_218816 [Plenodomus tracheiphilus IPT5]|uniref:Uncharacterized protein n=1 Tax=Plenodomus tracheiphilus IPT5 TaxID=1408161 RepID=A0A6A7AVZ4_9PLEO|nr:hypothetical protein T440DRAFT_218816 [Plenodomus tracheiphilus IPT5]